MSSGCHATNTKLDTPFTFIWYELISTEFPCKWSSLPPTSWCKPRQETVVWAGSNVGRFEWPDCLERCRDGDQGHTHTLTQYGPLEQSGAFTNWSEQGMCMDLAGRVWGSGCSFTARTPQRGPDRAGCRSSAALHHWTGHQQVRR